MKTFRYKKSTANSPANTARLHNPWKEAITDLPYNFSTPTACVFIAMFTRLDAIPNKNKADTSCATEFANDNGIKRSGYNKAPAITIFLLPKREQASLIKVGLPLILTGSAKRTPPRAPSLRCNLFGCRICGLPR